MNLTNSVNTLYSNNNPSKCLLASVGTMGSPLGVAQAFLKQNNDNARFDVKPQPILRDFSLALIKLCKGKSIDVRESMNMIDGLDTSVTVDKQELDLSPDDITTQADNIYLDLTNQEKRKFARAGLLDLINKAKRSKNADVVLGSMYLRLITNWKVDAEGSDLIDYIKTADFSNEEVNSRMLNYLDSLMLDDDFFKYIEALPEMFAKCQHLPMNMYMFLLPEDHFSHRCEVEEFNLKLLKFLMVYAKHSSETARLDMSRWTFWYAAK